MPKPAIGILEVSEFVYGGFGAFALKGDGVQRPLKRPAVRLDELGRLRPGLT
jgi:hypothetical protein